MLVHKIKKPQREQQDTFNVLLKTKNEDFLVSLTKNKPKFEFSTSVSPVFHQFVV